MGNKQKGKYSIKCINGRFYVYSWGYLPKRFRKKKKQHKRYFWKYIGVYGGAKANKYFGSLPIEEQQLVAITYKQKVHTYQVMEEMRRTIEEREPFKTQKINIMKIKNRNQRTNKLKKLNKAINDLIRNEYLKSEN